MIVEMWMIYTVLALIAILVIFFALAWTRIDELNTMMNSTIVMLKDTEKLIHDWGDVVESATNDIEKLKGSIDTMSNMEKKEFNSYNRRLIRIEYRLDNTGILNDSEVAGMPGTRMPNNAVGTFSTPCMESATTMATQTSESAPEADSVSSDHISKSAPADWEDSCDEDACDISFPEDDSVLNAAGDTDGDEWVPTDLSLHFQLQRRAELEEFAKQMNSSVKIFNIPRASGDSSVPPFPSWSNQEKSDETTKTFPKTVSYSWIFPKTDPESPKIYLQRYFVIGKLNGSDDIVSNEAFWNGYYFVSDYEPKKFDIVYAFIQIPKASDVMESVVSLALDKG